MYHNNLDIPHAKRYKGRETDVLDQVEAPSGDWKSILGVTLVLVSIGLWGFLWCKVTHSFLDARIMRIIRRR